MRLPTEARINNVPPVRLGPGNAPGATITSILIFRANVLNNLQPTSAGTAAPSANTDSGKQSFPTLASICKSTAEADLGSNCIGRRPSPGDWVRIVRRSGQRNLASNCTPYGSAEPYRPHSRTSALNWVRIANRGHPFSDWLRIVNRQCSAAHLPPASSAQAASHTRSSRLPLLLSIHPAMLVHDPARGDERINNVPPAHLGPGKLPG